MKRSNDKRVNRTKKALKNALLSLMEKKKYEDITITEIVKHAEYNRGTFYLHFEQKEDLLAEMMEEMLNELASAFRKPYKDLKEEVNIVELSTISIFDHFIENKDFYKIMLGPNVKINFQEKMILSLQSHFNEDVNFIINDCDSEIDLKLLYHYRVYGTIGLILEWIKSDYHYSRQFMADQVVKIATFHTEKVSIKM
ncbi:TetR/AcrR family transcriptional regulator [Oceanobacillus rekensis]|uniref:TetR/AcrR family transcriptional regulator n=1 Tax=Oceanobacillus rekensis TaxID=937927 RepID=UPI000B440405|nr:TetR/AcrR family transcriptional regulator [Oceanobacillus rekensis]